MTVSHKTERAAPLGVPSSRQDRAKGAKNLLLNSFGSKKRTVGRGPPRTSSRKRLYVTITLIKTGWKSRWLGGGLCAFLI
jgi:hypothetical protein